MGKCVVFQEQLLTTSLSVHHVFSLGQPDAPQEAGHSEAPRPHDPLQKGRRGHGQSGGGKLWLSCCGCSRSLSSCRRTCRVRVVGGSGGRSWTSRSATSSTWGETANCGAEEAVRTGL